MDNMQKSAAKEHCNMQPLMFVDSRKHNEKTYHSVPVLNASLVYFYPPSHMYI